MTRTLKDRLRRLIVPLLLLASGNAWALTASDGQVLEAMYAQSALSFDDSAALSCPVFQIYLAETPAQRARGLMFVRKLPADWGMLFVYATPRTISMYMKNTFIPLDMVFIDAEGVVVDVAANTTPGSLKSIRSKKPAVAVLEINGGLAQQLGIRAGTRTHHQAFKADTPAP